MIRNYKNSTDRHLISKEAVARAVSDSLSGKLSIRASASTHGIKKINLEHRVEKTKKTNVTVFTPAVFTHGSKYTH